MEPVLDIEMQPKTEGSRVGPSVPQIAPAGSTAAGIGEAPTLVPSGAVSMFERLALDPNVSVDKLERLIAMQERINAHNAKAAFDAAFVLMRPFIPTIIERARTDKTTYAPLEDIIEVVTPILSKFGFSLGFRTEWPGDKVIRVIGILTHQQGYSRESSFESGADKSGSKNDIQALASTVTYGKRYATNDLLCIVTRGEDKDGQGSRKQANGTPAPEGFEAWRLDMQATADNGLPALDQAWAASSGEFKRYLHSHERPWWEALKVRAAKAGGK